MKKSALLAVSALSLGVVGLASFTPIAGAASQTSEVKVNVASALGIGSGEEGEGITTTDSTDTTALASLNVDFGTLKPGDSAQQKSITVRTTNNTTTNGTLTATKAGASANLVKGSDVINFLKAAPSKATPGWSVQKSDGTFLDLDTTATVYSHPTGTIDKSEALKFDLTVPSTAPNGDYKTTIKYQFTAS